MNIPMIQPDDRDVYDLSDFCHSSEMENFSKHLYLQHKGARTGVIRGDDPFEDCINGISPKVFALLMMANEDLYFSPVAPHADAGIMLGLPLPFGQLNVYSMQPGCWTSPRGGTRFLGFTMSYNQHHKALASYLQNDFKSVMVLPGTENDTLVLASFFALDGDFYLNDICKTVCNLISTFCEIDSRLAQRN
jgi:hypothetical protein